MGAIKKFPGENKTQDKFNEQNKYRSSFQARFCDVDITMKKSGKGDPEELKEWLVKNTLGL